MTARVIRHVIVTGRVQGVGYRAWVSDEATKRNLTGWVRNRRDGSVEAVFCGDEQNVAAMIAACGSGPSMARVASVTVDESTKDELTSRSTQAFALLPTV